MADEDRQEDVVTAWRESDGDLFLEASRTWARIERKLIANDQRLDALADAARRTSHGDHTYDVDVQRTDCLLCAAIEDRYQPRWMDEPHEWLRDPIVMVADVPLRYEPSDDPDGFQDGKGGYE